MDAGRQKESVKIPEHTKSVSQPGIKLAPVPVPEMLSSSQLHALFDILTHEATYAEVESFKDPSTISNYGFPFAHHGTDGTPTYSKESSTPLLAGLLRSIVLPFPGVCDLPAEFWHVRFQGILEKLAEAELSESYDQGSLGTRKTLATAASSIHESVSRGILGGVEKGAKRDLNRKYDLSQAQDLGQAWEDGVHELLYGDLIDELFKCAAESQSLEEHSAGVQACAEYIIIHIATLLHHIFVLSPEGPYLLKLLEHVHRLLPYSMIKQTLRIGNAATMINGMMRLLLAKMGVGALSNWVGITQDADDGMNLLQRIIWLILSWDASEYRKTVDKIEKSKGDSAPSKEQLAAIREYISKPRHDHEEARKDSARTPASMVTILLKRSNPDLSSSITEAQHAQCVEYLSYLLHIRDREQIQNALCRQYPDFFTQAIKDFVACFENIIRKLHDKIDLREHVSAGEGFLTDFINVGKGKRGSSKLLGGWANGISRGTEIKTKTPSVEDYVALLRKNKQLLYSFLHQVASQCPDLTEDFRIWAKSAVKVFQQNRPSSPGTDLPETTGKHQDPKSKKVTKQRKGAAGALSSNLQHLFNSLSPETRAALVPVIDAHAEYLSTLEELSLSRMQRILDNMSSYDEQATSSSAPSSGWSTPFGLGGWPSSGKSTPVPASLKQLNMSYAGPGMFLSRWQQLIDDTIIAPSTLDGKLQSGRDIKLELSNKGKTEGITRAAQVDTAILARIAEEEAPKAPDVKIVVKLLSKEFRELVGNLLQEDERFAVPVVNEEEKRENRHRSRGLE